MSERRSSLAFVLAVGALLACQMPAAADELDPRLEAAVALYRQEGAEKALPEFERLAKASTDAKSIATRRPRSITSVSVIGGSASSTTRANTSTVRSSWSAQRAIAWERARR